ncbi:hypothetical protein PV332_10700 [Streptomyces scabiei]|uniref:hypothetical protein n=1 Tax=Streptomyces scabiei TaxID=1930 RepID=UPI0029A9E14B|nr:hypothetical protein [Streptomyces scabiei]MDX2575948.1 hypothetical protein [Streptomyces scabiei]MDX2885579.1 hypothetical protein [Streptomyces scabiei]MDX2993468.1 hypothetical protein [Streptomyces scabiei]MDX3028418.1 hypothetical protein [Streptomyces scabiei]MDX3047248.1 hypothetical protein [Streptomyces scabiei]
MSKVYVVSAGSFVLAARTSQAGAEAEALEILKKRDRVTAHSWAYTSGTVRGLSYRPRGSKDWKSSGIQVTEVLVPA